MITTIFPSNVFFQNLAMIHQSCPSLHPEQAISPRPNASAFESCEIRELGMVTLICFSEFPNCDSENHSSLPHRRKTKEERRKSRDERTKKLPIERRNLLPTR
ncbi:Neuronal Growth Regulator 1 [Manis pentadactyla]|nr:Neuronal Growth Regulator 1 [Manis pentadactyla]